MVTRKELNNIFTLLEHMDIVDFKFPHSHCIVRLEDYIELEKPEVPDGI